MGTFTAKVRLILQTGNLEAGTIKFKINLLFEVLLSESQEFVNQKNKD